MSQATDSPNTSRISFSSAGAVRRSKLERAHLDLIRALSALPPHRIVGTADAADVEGRADYLRQVYLAAIRYLEVIADDTLDHIASDGEVDWMRANILFWDVVNDGDYDVVGDLQRLGCRLALPVAA